MQMEDRLFGVRTAGIQNVHPSRSKGLPHGFRKSLDEEHRGIQVLTTYIEEVGGVCEGGNEAMPRCQESVFRQEGDGSVRPVYYDGRGTSGCDLTKDTTHA